MGSSLSSFVTSYHQLSSRSFRSFNSFSNATSLLTSQQPVPLLPLVVAPARLEVATPAGSAAMPIQIYAGVNPPVAPTDATVQVLVDPPTTTSESATPPIEVSSVNSLTGIDPPQDESRRIAELAQPVAVAAIAVTLLVNTPQSSAKQNLLFLYNAYLVALCLSLFTSIGLSMYSLIKSTPNQAFPWFQKRVMIISIGSILISVMLRLILVLSTATMGYDGLSFVAIVAGIILYLWYSWRKSDNSNLTAVRSENNTQ